MATHKLDTFLRSLHKAVWEPKPAWAVTPTTNPGKGGANYRPIASNMPGIGPGGWDSKALSNAQGQTTGRVGRNKTLYRLYTEDTRRNETIAIVKRYFDGATMLYGVGLDARTQQADENVVVIEIVSSKPDALQRIVDLAGDLRVANKQISVLITRQSVDTFEVTEQSALDGVL